MQDVNIMESSKVTVKSQFVIKTSSGLVNLIGTSKEFKKDFLDSQERFLRVKKRDYKHLTEKVIPENKAKGIHDVETFQKASSISKTIVKIQDSINLIIESFIIDKQSIEDTIFIPIEENIKYDTIKYSELIDEVIANNPDLFRSKMYEILSNTNDSDTIITAIKEIAKGHGYKLIKSSK